jgi:hypothetical protein
MEKCVNMIKILCSGSIVTTSAIDKEFKIDLLFLSDNHKFEVNIINHNKSMLHKHIKEYYLFQRRKHCSS